MKIIFQFLDMESWSSSEQYRKTSATLLSSQRATAPLENTLHTYVHTLNNSNDRITQIQQTGIISKRQRLINMKIIQ